MRVKINIPNNEIRSHSIDNYRLGILIIDNISVEPSGKQLKELIQKTFREISIKMELKEINKLPAIESTRKAYKLAGNDPARYRPSADSLLRRMVKGIGINSINNLVDILNIVSIKSGFSIGGYDIDKISGDVIYGIGLKDELYSGIGRGKLNIECLPVLRDDYGAFGCPTSDSERTMITIETKNIAFVFYDFGKHDFLVPMMEYTSELLRLYCKVKFISYSIIGPHN